MRRSLFLFLCVSMAGFGLADSVQTNMVSPTGSAIAPLLKGANPGLWTMDLDAARRLAKERDMPLLLFFTGSDWCGYCKLITTNVLIRHEWEEYAARKFVLVTLDFPRNTNSLPKQYATRNEQLMRKYNVAGFPTYLVLESDGETVLGRFGIERNMTPFTFIGSAGMALRNRPAEIKRIVDRLPESDAAEYRRLLDQQRTAARDLDIWLTKNKEETPEAAAAYQQQVRALAGLNRALQEFEIGASFLYWCKQSQVDARRKAGEYLECAKILELRKADLDGWLLGRAETNAISQKAFAELLSSVQDALEQLRAIK